MNGTLTWSTPLGYICLRRTIKPLGAGEVCWGSCVNLSQVRTIVTLVTDSSGSCLPFIGTVEASIAWSTVSF